MPFSIPFKNGILSAIMATVEIDKAGRIVVPKHLRDALHLTPGTKLTVKRAGDTLVLEQDFPEATLEKKDGLWIMTGCPATIVDIPDLIQRGYQERNKRIMEGSGLE
jgi:AbrB family looped-hinge helix DNA binding protein